MKYLIHACESRLWYVNEYLIPSMLEQDIPKKEIIVYVDTGKKGNLQSFVDSLELCEDKGGMWHLQDDVILSRIFSRDTKLYKNSKNIVCGFCSLYDHNLGHGTVNTKKMWYSFPCIYIPNSYAKQFYDWYKSTNKLPAWVDMYVRHKKGDDTLFRYYAEDINPQIEAINHYPNLVDHVDWLIGGSLVNKTRNQKQVRATYFYDNDLVEKLKETLNNSLYQG